MELTKLSQAYLAYRKSIAFGTPEIEANSEFGRHILSYVESIDGLFTRGAGAFLTTELESKILEFDSFIAESIGTSDVISRVVVQYGISLFRMNSYARKGFKISGKAAKFWQGKFGFSQFGVSIKFDGEMVLAAPLSSKEFDEAFSFYMSILNLLIKEVTLGSMPRTNA